MKKILHNIITSFSGQSLLEIVIAMGLLIVVVTAITITTSNGLKNSQASKNQTIAVQLAQEGIDIMRDYGRRNCTVDPPSTNNFWNTPAAINGVVFYSINSTDCQLRSSTTEIPDDSLNDTQEDIFRRVIRVRNSGSAAPLVTQREITVTVTWTDSTGSHSSQLITFLGR